MDTFYLRNPIFKQPFLHQPDYKSGLFDYRLIEQLEIFHAQLTSNLTDVVSGADATFTRAFPGTYIGSDGLIHLAVINEARFESGALLLEPASTNLCTESYGVNVTSGLWDDWTSTLGTKSVVSASDVFDSTDFPDAKWQRIQHTFTGSEASDSNLFNHITTNDSFAQNDKFTVSFRLKGALDLADGKSLKIHIQGRDNTGSSTELILHDTTTLNGISGVPSLITVTGIIANASTTKIDVMIGNYDWTSAGTGPASGDTVDLYITAVQIEKQPVRTSFIPTAGSVFPRATEAGNTRWYFTDISDVLSALSSTGTMVIEWKPGYANNVLNATYSGIINCSSTTISLLFNIIHSSPSFRSFDGTTYNSLYFDYQQIFNGLFVRWETGENFELGIVVNGEITSNEAVFDGAFISGTYLGLGHQIPLPIYVKNLKIFDKKLSDSEIKNEL